MTSQGVEFQDCAGWTLPIHVEFIDKTETRVVARLCESAGQVACGSPTLVGDSVKE